MTPIFFTKHLQFILIAACLLVGCGPLPLVSVTSLPNRPPLAAPNDALFNSVLERSVDSSGKIDYTALKNDSALTEYLRQLAVTKTDGFVSRSYQLAFWINAHNAGLLDLLRLNHPARGLVDVSSLRSAQVLVIGGQTYSVSDIERNIVAKQFREPRAFFALVTGGRSSPKLLNKVYAEATLSAQLDRAVQQFIADSTKNRVGHRPSALYLSELFRTYSDELAQASGTLVAFVRAFASGPIAEFLSNHASPDLNYLPYDWKQ